MSGTAIRTEIMRLSREKPHKAISWTGGEPLLHVPFLLNIMPWAREQGLLNYLETNGTLVEPFKKIKSLCDIVAMDIKLPSATGREAWSEHLEFLKLLPRKSFAKVILTHKTTDAEWRQVIRILQESSPDIPLILQPATEHRRGSAASNAVGERPTPTREIKTIEPVLAIKFLRQAQALLKDARLIPQWHPIWGLH